MQAGRDIFGQLSAERQTVRVGRIAAGAGHSIHRVLLFALALAIQPGAHAQEPDRLGSTQAFASALHWRNIGPDRGGRSIAVAGSAVRPHEAYFGATGGGLWKTTDAGTTWRPVTDGQIGSSSVGAIAVAPSDPDVVYIGMGEAQLRGNVMQGDGMYGSQDGGRTWRHLGLAATRTIARVRVDPSNSARVFVAALGDPTKPTTDRGVYRSIDGGVSWEQVLYRGERAGAVDLVIDPQDPDVLYAAFWEVQRNAYRLWSGGEGSGLFRSCDGGTTWEPLSDNAGFPQGVLGKIGVAVSPVDSQRLYAVVEAHEGGLYSSDDAGDTWALVNSDRALWQRSFYFNRVVADPVDRDGVFVLNFRLLRSRDGGRTTSVVRTPHVDHHDLWIDPGHPERMVCANDGGGTLTVNGGRTWTHQDYPTAQMYHVEVTNDFPYHVAGAQQDNSTAVVYSSEDHWSARPRTRTSRSFYSVGGGENGFIASHPEDTDVFFAGATNTLTRFDRRTGELRDVHPYPRIAMGESSAEIPERWNWVYPIVFSRSGPPTLYVGSQHLWRSADEGQTWQKISPDLTRANPQTLGPSGGPIRLDQDGPEVYATLYSIAPSLHDAATLYTGSDDGLVHVTRDGGRRWVDVTPDSLVPNTRVTSIEVSAHRPQRVHVAGKRNQMGDRSPLLWTSDDYGATWREITAGLPPEDFAHVLREDPVREGLLYLGTEHGVHVSWDGGASWDSLRLDLPDVQVCDLVVKENDLVIATHGRSFFVLDNIEVLRQWRAGGPDALILFEPGDATIRGSAASLHVFSPEACGAALRITAPDGSLAKEFTDLRLEPGVQSVRWDLRVPGAVTFEGMVLESPSPARGPHAPPGVYSVELLQEDQVLSRCRLQLVRPPSLRATEEDLAAQHRLALQVRDAVDRAHRSLLDIRAIKAAIEDRSLAASLDEGARAGAKRLLEALSAVEGALYQTKNQSPKDKIAYPIRLNDRLAGLMARVDQSPAAPRPAHVAVFEELSAELDALLGRANRLLDEDLDALNEVLQAAGTDPVIR